MKFPKNAATNDKTGFLGAVNAGFARLDWVVSDVANEFSLSRVIRTRDSRRGATDRCNDSTTQAILSVIGDVRNSRPTQDTFTPTKYCLGRSRDSTGLGSILRSSTMLRCDVRPS